MDWETLTFDGPLVGKLAQEAQLKWAKKVGTDRRLFNLSCHHNQSLSVFQLKGALRQLAREEDFVPSMVVVDYADNLMASNEKLSTRDQHALNWDVLRGIAMENNCAVITATQVNRPGYEVKILQMKHISEEKRKIAHVTMLVGINQQPQEKTKGLYRLNCIKNRNNDFSSYRCCYVLSCLPLANPAVLSVFPFKGFDVKEGDEE
jgi:replicative DNA helicase